MDGLLVILIIVFFALQGKKKKTGKNSRGGRSEAAKKMTPIDKAIKNGFGEMKELIKDVGTAIGELTDDDEAEKAAAPAAKAKVPGRDVQLKMNIPAPGKHIPEGTGMPGGKSMQGKSLMDAQGCVGGSLPHIGHEGESREEHGDHMRRAQESQADTILAEDIARELQDMNVRRLRRAIVVSEILDKPKALRRR